ncbi:metal-dependent hydrolase [Zoogloea sp.]|uniref:metal-dependent hydrolase n=1 Tax=Zoogloea sp. TaxID=49181 RepID=UPI0032200B19
MPFTPFHMGPGLLIKAAMQGAFSLMVFGWAQIVMDVQPLVVILTGEGHLHGFTHTWIGASLLGIASALSGKYLSEFGLRLMGCHRLVPIVWPVAVLSAFVGTFSHVLLDGIMHADVEPFWPFSRDNALLGLLSVRAMHWFCLGSGLVGAVLYFIVARRRVARGGGGVSGPPQEATHAGRGCALSAPQTTRRSSSAPRR